MDASGRKIRTLAVAAVLAAGTVMAVGADERVRIGLPSPAGAGLPAQGFGPSAALAQAEAGPDATAIELARGAQCVYLRDVGGSLRLVNICDSCVTVQVENRRPTGDLPAHRTLTLPSKGGLDLPVSFRQGRTRVLAEQSCASAVPADAAVGQCVNLYPGRDGLPVLVNACGECRAVTLERTQPGGGRTLQTFRLTAKTYLPVSANGADRARILGEDGCS